MLSRLHQSSPKLPNSREMASWQRNGSRLLRAAKAWPKDRSLAAVGRPDTGGRDLSFVAVVAVALLVAIGVLVYNLVG